MNNDPANCTRCDTGLERGWSCRYKGDIVEYICFDCDLIDIIGEYKTTNIITSRLSTVAAIDEVKQEYGKPIRLSSEILNKLLNSENKINHAIKLWERDVWFGGLQKKVRASNARGWKLEFDGRYVMVYSLAGRTQFTIESSDQNSQITTITAEDSCELIMGQNSINATEEQALELLNKSREAYINGAQFQKDDQVGLGF
jgi:hypothetical protein